MAANTVDETIAEQFLARGAALCTAESCTGGLIAHRITGVPGASNYFLGGIVAYSNEAKENLLGVPRDLLAAHGAVSEPVARAMAESARRVFRADYAVGVTGIAGPGGGTPEKPVGLVFIAIAGPDGTVVSHRQFDGPREVVKEQSADAALTLLLEQLG